MSAPRFRVKHKKSGIVYQAWRDNTPFVPGVTGFAVQAIVIRAAPAGISHFTDEEFWQLFERAGAQ